jgi:hypothetical protein
MKYDQITWFGGTKRATIDTNHMLIALGWIDYWLFKRQYLHHDDIADAFNSHEDVRTMALITMYRAETRATTHMQGWLRGVGGEFRHIHNRSRKLIKYEPWR